MAKTILMIHGFGCAGDSWAPVAQRLRAEGYRVETPTLRAEQRKVSAPGAGLADLGLADYVADMSALAASLAQQDGEAPIAFGHSMGGMIAQKLAEAGLIAGAVLFAPASPADARGKPKLSPVFAFLNAALMPSPETKTVKQWKPGFKWGVMNAVPASRHDALYSKMVFDSGRVLSNLAWPDKDPHKTATVDVDKVKVPLLVVAGALDRTTPVDDLRLVGQKYSAVGGDYVEYPNNAHWLIDEPGSDVILGDVIAWLKNKALVVAPAKPAPAPAPAPAAVAAPVVAKAPVEKAPAKAASARCREAGQAPSLQTPGRQGRRARQAGCGEGCPRKGRARTEGRRQGGSGGEARRQAQGRRGQAGGGRQGPGEGGGQARSREGRRQAEGRRQSGARRASGQGRGAGARRQGCGQAQGRRRKAGRRAKGSGKGRPEARREARCGKDGDAKGRRGSGGSQGRCQARQGARRREAGCDNEARQIFA